MASQKVLIFDFDGTIADSTDKIIEVLNNLAPDFGIEKVSDGEIERLKGLNSRELIKEFRVPIYKIPFMYSKFRREFGKIMPSIKPINGIPEVIKKLHEKGQKMYIVSSNSEGNILLFLRNNSMDYFDLIMGDVGLFGKYIKLRRIIRDRNLNKNDIIYIGDETRDIESARKTGIKIAAVTWGLSTKEALEKENPDFLLSKPEELLSL